MAKLVKNKNIKDSIQDNLKENIIELPKEDKTRNFFVTTDEEGNIKGYFPIKDKKLGKDWFAMYQIPALWLAQQNMTGEQYRVLFALFSKLDFDNYLRVSRADIADALEIAPTRVSRAMKILKDKKIIAEGPPAGKFKTYRLNPYIAHKGKNRSSSILDFEDALSAKGKNRHSASDVIDS